MTRILFFCAVALLLTAGGCQNGCTTSRTMDSQSSVVKVNGQTIRLTASVMDYRNSKRIGNNLFRRKVTHTYGVTVDFTYRNNEFRDAYSQSVKDPDNVDLDEVIKQVKFKVSKDGNHLAIGVGDEVVSVYHFYKNMQIENVSAVMHTPEPGSSWKEVQINSFPSPKEMILRPISDLCEFNYVDLDLVVSLMDDLSPSDTAHRMLLRQWPRCQIALDYYTSARVKKLQNNSTWKKWALASGLRAVQEGSDLFNETAINSFVEALNDKHLNRVSDSLMALNWGGKGDDQLTNTLADRMSGRLRPLDPAIRKQVRTLATNEFNRFLRTGESDYHYEAYACMRILKACGDTVLISNFLEQAFGSRQQHFNQFDLIECIYDNYHHYTPAQQLYIKEHTPQFFGRTEDYARSVMFRAVEGIVSCDQLRRWKKDYAKDLDFCQLPKGC